MSLIQYSEGQRVDEVYQLSALLGINQQAENRNHWTKVLEELDKIVSDLKCIHDETRHREEILKRRVKSAKKKETGLKSKLERFFIGQVEANKKVSALRDDDSKCNEKVLKDVNSRLSNFKEKIKLIKKQLNGLYIIYDISAHNLVKMNNQIDELIQKIDCTPIPQGFEEIISQCSRVLTILENTKQDFIVKMYQLQKIANARSERNRSDDISNSLPSISSGTQSPALDMNQMPFRIIILLLVLMTFLMLFVVLFPNREVQIIYVVPDSEQTNQDHGTNSLMTGRDSMLPPSAHKRRLLWS